MLLLRGGATTLDLGEESAVIVRSRINGGQGMEAELRRGTLLFCAARAAALEIVVLRSLICLAEDAQTIGQVTVIGAKELRIYARRGSLQFSYGGETRTIAEGQAYRVILDPPENDPKKKEAVKAGRQRKGFLFVAMSGGAAAAAAIMHENHRPKQMESPGHPGFRTKLTMLMGSATRSIEARPRRLLGLSWCRCRGIKGENAGLNEFEAGEEVCDFEGGGFPGVGAVRAIVADAGAEVVADGAGHGFLGVGGAHSVAPLEDGAFGFEDQREDLARAHETTEFAKERALSMDGIEASGFALSEDHSFDGHYAEASFVDTRENFTLKIARYSIGFDECESSFHGHENFLRII
jgi:hypothetical protein